MKRYICNINSVAIISLFFFNACRSSDIDSTIINSSTSMLNFNLLETEFTNSCVSSSLASLNKNNTNISESSNQTYSVLIDPSTVIVAELAAVPASDLKGVVSVSKINPAAAISGSSLSSLTKFRIIAYSKKDGAYITHQDYTVGQKADPMTLVKGVSYDIIAYSFGTKTLPIISTGEKKNINNAIVNYDNNNRDFMYQKITSYTPVNANNTLNIILRHKVALITTVINSYGEGNITSINNAILTPHYSDGVFSLSSGDMSKRTRVSSATLNFPSSGFPGTTQTANPVFVNSNSGTVTNGGFSANITIGGQSKTIKIPDFFKIIPEHKSNLTINLNKCGAYIGPGIWKAFMCHNLGADTNMNPFVPTAGIHGAKYKWGAQTGQEGHYISQENDQKNEGSIRGWTLSSNARGSWLDESRGPKDPCPQGYKVPSRAQWQGVIDNNRFERVGSWANSNTNFTTALYITDSSGRRTLMLPASGIRLGGTGIPQRRGLQGTYWTSTVTRNQNAFSYPFIFENSRLTVSSGNHSRSHGSSVRCIAL